jgi:hypothetical protein
MRNLQYIAEDTSLAGIILGIVEKSKRNYAGIRNPDTPDKDIRGQARQVNPSSLRY